MPLTRQKHKNSSRSPGAGISSASYFQSTSAPKGFHPPSYYAAAAGLTHPHPDDDKSVEAEIRRTTTVDRSLADADDSFVAPTPTAQLPTSSSASSTEPSLVSRMSFLNKRLSKANGMNNKSSKRKSQFADLPLVEAQLVPSLRDTIDRMTNSPSSPAPPPIIFPHTPLQWNSHDPLPSPSQHQPYPSTPPGRPPQMSPIKTAYTPPTSLPRYQNVLEGSRIPTPVTAAKAKPNLKPALKNTVASTSTWCSGQGSPTKASPSRSLRSVKGIIGRKMPQIPADPIPSDMTGVQTGNVTSGRVTRERSHTDPGHVSRIPSRSPHIQATPRVPPPVFTFPTPRRESQQIPLNRGYDSSGSELNLQTDRGRALFVTNAVIVPSSSSSSSSEDVETSRPPPYDRVNSPAWSSRTPQQNRPYGGRSAQSGVGLGLGTPETMGNAHSHPNTLMASRRPDADIESEYDSDPGDEDANPLVISPSASSARLRSLVLNRQISRPDDLNGNSSTTSRDVLPNPWDHDDAKPSEGDQRRRELIELVNEMDTGLLGSAQTHEYDNLSDDEYTGEQGLAISPSDDFDNNMHTTLKPRDENGTYQRRRSPVAGQAAPRHLTSAPTFSGERTEYSPQRNLSSVLAKDRATNAPRKKQGAELSPLSEYSGDEEAQYVTNRTISQRAHVSPLTMDHSSFKSIREGDRPLSPRESSSRVSIVGVALPNSTHLRTFGSGRSSEKTLRTSREPSTTSSFKSNFDGAHSPGGNRGIRDLNRARKCKGMQYSPHMRNHPLPHADSSSSIESLRWQHEDQSISLDAEAIFEQLDTGHQSAAHENSPRLSQQQGKGLDFPTNRSPKPPSPRETPNSLREPDPIQQPRRDKGNSQTSDSEQRTWLTTVSSSTYHSLLDRYGEVEIERQQIIWDLCETERVFVRRLQTFVRLFICPLRMKDSVTWLAGVPPEVARLFDWLEDIINLHAQISSALRAIVSEQYPIVMRIAGRLRSFVSRLEVHQPYVVRLESTTLSIKRLSGEPSNDFGEFIRIQQEQEECHGWTVEAFLVEPVNRLVDYPMHFKRLLDATPQGHPDHLATFSLLHCTETIIRVMREVKLQEEEYELVKDRLGHIKGLPASLQLAHRSRRLLARGRLERENSRAKARAATIGGDLQDHRRSHHATGVRQSRLISVIQSRVMRSDSIRTTSESTTSMGSHFSEPHSSDFFRHSPSASSLARQDVWERQFTSPRNAHPILESRAETLYTLVFNDLALFASPIFDPSIRHDWDMPGDSWNLIEGIGISRILKVTEDSNQIVLDLLPVDLENIATGRIPDSGQVVPLSICVPPVSSSGAQLDMAGLSRLRHNWVSAFQECAEYTLRALSFPTESGKLTAPTPGSVWDSNPQTSVSAILASGLPLPKSPSAQMAEQSSDPSEQEREARGWWCLRFQQVLREMQRGFAGALITAPSSSTPRPDGDTAGKRHISQPRVL